MTAHEPLRPLTRHAISPPSNMIIPFSNSISPMETSLPVCPFRQGRFPFAGDLLRTFQAVSFEGKAAPHGTVAARRKYRRSAMPPLCKGRWRGIRRDGGVANTKSLQGPTYQSLSQPDGCQLPLHKGAYGVRNRKRQRKACAFHRIRFAALSTLSARRRQCLTAMHDLIRGGTCPFGLPCGANTFPSRAIQLILYIM